MATNQLALLNFDNTFFQAQNREFWIQSPGLMTTILMTIFQFLSPREVAFLMDINPILARSVLRNSALLTLRTCYVFRMDIGMDRGVTGWWPGINIRLNSNSPHSRVMPVRRNRNGAIEPNLIPENRLVWTALRYGYYNDLYIHTNYVQIRNEANVNAVLAVIFERIRIIRSGMDDHLIRVRHIHLDCWEFVNMQNRIELNLHFRFDRLN